MKILKFKLKGKIQIYLVFLVFYCFISHSLNAQDSACCVVSYLYNMVDENYNAEKGTIIRSFNGKKLEFFCDSTIIRFNVKRLMYGIPNIREFNESWGPYYLTDSSLLTFYHDSLVLLFSKEMFLNRDTTELHHFYEDKGGFYRYELYQYFPIDIYWYKGGPVYRYAHRQMLCRTLNEYDTSECLTGSYDIIFIDFHPLYGEIRRGISSSYIEIADYPCRENINYFKVEGDCEKIRNILNNGWFNISTEDINRFYGKIK